MPTLDDYLSNKQQYPDDQKISLADGVETTLGQLRGGFMKDSDYRKKTADVARERERFERDRSDWETARYDAEAKLTDLAKQLVSQRPEASRDEIEDALERDPVAKRLATQLEAVTKKLGALEQATVTNQNTAKMHEQAWLAEQHRRVLNQIKQHDPSLDTEELVRFAKDNMVPRLDHAYRLMTYERQIEASAKNARDAGLKEGFDRAKTELNQPVLPSRRLFTPAEDAPKTFEQAADRALQDPEILKIINGQG